MKKIFTQILAVCALIAVTFTAQAKDVELGELALDTEYQIPGDFNTYYATFTPTQDGVLTATSTQSDTMEPFVERLSNMTAEGNMIAYTSDSDFPAIYHFNVTAGTTYVFYKRFSMNAFTFTLSMSGSNSIEVKSVSPAQGSQYSISGDGLVTVEFNRAVNINKTADVVFGSNVGQVAINGSSPLFSIEPQHIIAEWLKDGVIKEGDQFSIKIYDVKAADDESIVYGTDGTVVIDYIMAGMPYQLVSTENTDGAFKSYYLPDDPTAIVKLTFDGNITKALARITFGDVETENEFYAEELPVTIDGKTISVDLSGKRRRPSDMVGSGTDYMNLCLEFNEVMGDNDQYVYSSGQGTIGSFSFTYSSIEVITANIFCEFTPASNSTLTEETTQLEIWITDEAKLQYDGVQFDYTGVAGEVGSVVVSNYTKEVDSEDPTASILYVPLPEELKEMSSVTVTLSNLVCADGNNHSNDVKAFYYLNMSGVDKVFGDDTTRYVVYNIQGIRILDTTNRDAINNLPAGVYIINGKKFLFTE